MSKFCVAPGVNSRVAVNLAVLASYTRTIPFWGLVMFTSDKPARVPLTLPASEETTFTAFC